MKPSAIGTIFFLATSVALGQTAEAPTKFEAADVHASVKPSLTGMARTSPVRGGRYELKNATMLDLIRIASGYDADKILGGPSWLELNRYDLVAKVPAGTTPESQKSMLQALLEERFKLVMHKETKPLPSYALLAGKKPLLKEAAGTEEPGCKMNTSSSPVAGGATIRMGAAVAEAAGVPATLNLGPGGTVEYQCRNITMAAFAEGLRRMSGAGSVGPNPTLDETGLTGKWNFELRLPYLVLNREDAEHVTVFDAIEKLGLKLEPRPVPTPVVVVDSVNEKPIPNPPGTANLLPAIPPPAAFEVASVKPTPPGGRGGSMQMQPGGRFTVQNMPMRTLILRAFSENTSDQILGLPDWANTERFDVMAKAPEPDPSAPALDVDATAPMVRALLADRFKLTYHTEDRELPAYSLVAGKPKMKKADPASRTSCKFPPPAPGAPPGSRVMACQNITMAQFADRLQRLTNDLGLPLENATELEGSWDFTLTFNPTAGMMGGRGGPGAADAAPGAGPSAADPGGSYTIFEAMEKQLGLKLEKRKRVMPVVVIDHLEQKPTEN